MGGGLDDGMMAARHMLGTTGRWSCLYAAGSFLVCGLGIRMSMGM